MGFALLERRTCFRVKSDNFRLSKVIDSRLNLVHVINDDDGARKVFEG